MLTSSFSQSCNKGTISLGLNDTGEQCKSSVSWLKSTESKLLQKRKPGELFMPGRHILRGTFLCNGFWRCYARKLLNVSSTKCGVGITWIAGMSHFENSGLDKGRGQGESWGRPIPEEHLPRQIGRLLVCRRFSHDWSFHSTVLYVEIEALCVWHLISI